jgi:peptidoglycan/xylan/chitin deacetylase (PgdA/CDA1 family)
MERLYSDAIFRIKTNEKRLLLTFDDGPDPASTPLILEILSTYHVSAIFFCTGIKAEKYPGLMETIRSSGHTIGNHGYSHLSGWKTSKSSYVADIERADGLTSSDLFRPPYGRLTPGQYSSLKKKYKIFFWDLMPYDFDTSLGVRNVIKILREKIRPGSIIVLHDSPLSCAAGMLEEFLEYAGSEGYGFAGPWFNCL